MKLFGDIDICGDIHGQIGAIRYWINHGNSTNLLHVGDFGVFPKFDTELVQLGGSLNKRGKRIYVCRGNHEVPEMFDNRIYGGEWGGIQLIKDGSILESNKYGNIFCVGGAISVDRQDRTENLDYWKDEIFSSILPPKDVSINHVITHTSFPEVTGMPIYAPIVLNYAANDADLIHDIMMEAQIVKNWIDTLIDSGNHNIKSWHYGHFHRSILSEYRGIKCRCLDINEIAPFDKSQFFS